ncbi:MAG: NYN domain-containing protein [Candidatus Staskawiczbacteria bacterium]|nr:NYN domain-containing protein [Candidatus Staskawiczbacteria bacterium]
MVPKENNFAFIDSQNLHLGVKSMGWVLDMKRFRIYLKEKHNVSKTYLFIGFMAQNQRMYNAFQEYGYTLIFKPVIDDKEPKGNIDADLILQAMIDFHEEKFDKAVIVTSDGDFYSLVDYFYENKKLKTVISPYYKTCSSLLRKTAKEKLEYKRKSTA